MLSILSGHRRWIMRRGHVTVRVPTTRLWFMFDFGRLGSSHPFRCPPLALQTGPYFPIFRRLFCVIF